LIDADGTKLRRLTTGGGEPAWSPDGSQLAFIRNNPSTRFTSLFVIATDGSGERQLPCPVAASEPAWSPDGRQIAFHGAVRGHPASWGIVRADPGGKRCRLWFADDPAFDGSNYNPSWSPDGTKIALTIADEHLDVPELFVEVVSLTGNPNAYHIRLDNGCYYSDCQIVRWAPAG